MPQEIWPLHLKPKKDELLTSLVSRLAMAYALSYRQFCTVALKSASPLLTPSWFIGDADSVSDLHVFSYLAERTGTDIGQIEDTTLAAYHRVLRTLNQLAQRSPWILPSEKIQYCSQCLVEDETPYFRRKWRLAFLTACEIHHVLLSDACPTCHSNISFRQSLSTHSYDSQFFSIIFCYACSADIRQGAPRIVIGGDEVKFQAFLSQSLQQSWIELPSKQKISPQQYFINLRKLARRLTTGKNAQSLQGAIIATHKIDSSLVPAFDEIHDQVESLAIQSRRALLIMLGCLMSDWPLKPMGYLQGKASYNKSIFKEAQAMNAEFSQAVRYVA